jgi:hypothetical protein
MTNLEKTMYDILGKVSQTNAPIVFKGALITKLILDENGFAELDRPTVDIDANWYGTPPSMEDLVDSVNKSLITLDEGLYAEATREYGERKSAGLSIINPATGKEVITMDIDIKPSVGERIYYYGEIGIKGVLANEILADKITVLSNMNIFWRAKDLIDVYALAHCVSVNTADIFEIVQLKANRTIGAFEEFYKRQKEVKHAYEELKGIKGKPSFGEVYAYLTTFVEPFAKPDLMPSIWNFEKPRWETADTIRLSNPASRIL